MLASGKDDLRKFLRFWLSLLSLLWYNTGLWAFLPGMLCRAAESRDFLIGSKGVLTKYTGSDAVVTVPQGVTSIGRYAFSACTRLSLARASVGCAE